jgi:predicted nucleic acid-binding protein
MRTVFLDTVGLLALWDNNDQWHGAAEQAMNALLKQPCRFVTTVHVIWECGNAAARTSFRSEVVALRLELAGYGNLLQVTPDEEAQAWVAYSRGEAGQAGIVDHISFILLRRLALTDAFTNDRHFAAAGFTTLF